MRTFVISLCLLVVLPFWAAASQTSGQVRVNRADMIRMLGELPGVLPFRRDLTRLGFRGQNLELAVTHAGSFYKDPTIAGYVADRVIAAYTNPTFEVAPQGLIWPLIERGMGHLTLGELRFYYSVEQAMINSLSSRECGLAVRGRMSDKRFSEAMSRKTAQLDTKTLQEFYRVELKAARLGAVRAPVRLSQQATARTAEKVDQRMSALVEAAPDTERLQQAMRNLERTDNTSACRVGRMFYQAVMTLNRNDLRDGLLYLGAP